MDLPLHFSDNLLCSIIKANEGEPDLISECKHLQYQFPLNCGLTLRLRAGFHRIVRRSLFHGIRDEDQQYQRLYTLFTFLCKDVEELSKWDPISLWDATEEISKKSVNLSAELQKELSVHPLYPRDVNGNLVFHSSFLKKICEYHQSVQRPAGTFEMPEDFIEHLQPLTLLGREKCPYCLTFQHLYCGPCLGVRMPSANELLPQRVKLPFNIHIFLHWQDSLQKCTSVHAGALCEEGTVTLSAWPRDKTEADWKSLVGELDAERDVILFPTDNATSASEFDWNRIDVSNLKNENKNNKIESFSSQSQELSLKWRLVVLEASWRYAKTMAQQIVQYRIDENLPPLQFVSLSEITGEYWRFHAEGHSAVSTIEAIAHTAKEAGIIEDDFNSLLCLFRLQKYRVLQNITKGYKVPRAVEVTGDGEGSWKKCSELLIEEDNDNIESGEKN
eukprot:gene16058-21807_t